MAKVSDEKWFVFSHDRKFHTRLPEMAAIKQHNGACFYLPGAESPTWEKMKYFMRGIDGIEERIANAKRPFIFDLAYTGRFKQIVIP